MQTVPLVVLTCALSAGVGAATATLLSPSDTRAADDRPALAPEFDPERLARLEERQRALAEELEEVRFSVAGRGGDSSGRVSLSEVEALVAKALEGRGVEATRSSEAPEATEPAGEFDAESFAREILAGGTGELSEQEIWEEVRELGKTDEVLAWFKQNAKDHPDDAQAQVELANAYLQKLFALPEGPMKGQFANLADQAFDRALALDDRHWEARFSKAISLSFWPPAFGKQQEAISQFETLLAQQQEQPLQQGFNQTYLYLGNLYSQTGQTAQAIATWQAGLELYPEDEEMAAQLEILQQGSDD